MKGDLFLERHGRTPEDKPFVTVCMRVRPIVEEDDFNMAALPSDAPTGTAP